MPVPNSMADLATLASSNFPTGTEAIGNSLDNYIRAISAIIRSTNAIASASIASASTTDVALADGQSVAITGSATINSFGTGFAGCVRELRFSGACTIVASSNIGLPASANLVTASGDALVLRCISPGVWSLVGGSRDANAVRKTGDTMTGGLSIVSQGAGISLGFRDAANTITRYFIGCDDTSLSFNNINDAGSYSGTPVRIYRNNSGVDFGGLVKSATAAAGFNAVDRTSGREWTMYGTSDIWRVNAGGIGDLFTLDASGNATAAGNLVSNSDESLKRDWADLASDLVERLAGVKAGEYERIDTGIRQVGVGAQSLEQALPLAVSVGGNGFKSVAYGNAALVGVVAIARRLIELERALGVKNAASH